MKASTNELIGLLAKALREEALESKDTSDLEGVADFFSELMDDVTVELENEETNQEES